jgi:hypothetical protein
MVEKFVRQIERECSTPKLDLNLLRKKGNSKTFTGYMIQKMKEAREQENWEMVQVIQHFYKKYLEFQKHENVVLKSWKGKSSLKIIEKPDYFTIITFQRPDQDHPAEEIRRDITRMEVNKIINVLNELNKGEKISTRDIGEKAYKREWNFIFSDRILHCNLNLILRLLDFYGLTHYRGKYTTVLKPVREIQEV